MANSGRYVFRATINAHEQLTRLFDFAHPTAIAMWNLRWQVQGFLASVPNATTEDLNGRFAMGANLRSGALKRAAVETSWDHQLKQFASIILINTIAAFEDFTANVGALRFTEEKKARELSEALQFPSTHQKGSKVSSLLAPPSTVLSDAVTWTPAVARRYTPGTQDALLLCYRYFKEIRNAIAHNGGRANERTVDAYGDFVAAIRNNLIGGAPVPQHLPVTTIGDLVEITHYGVVGFSEIVLRILTGYEIMLTGHKIAEEELRQRIALIPKISWPSDRDRQARRIERIFFTARFPPIIVTPALRQLLAQHQLVPAFVG